jgi:hypothetical protein
MKTNANNKAITILTIIIGVLLLLVAILSVQLISSRDNSAFIPDETESDVQNVVHVYEVYIIEDKDEASEDNIPEIFDETDEVVTDVVDVVDEIVTEPVTETETSVKEVVEGTVDTTVDETIHETEVEEEVIDDEETYWPAPSIPEIEDEFTSSEPEIEEEQETEEDDVVVPDVMEEEVPEVEEDVTTDTEVDVETETETETEEGVTSEPETEEVVPENNVNETVVRETKFSMANGEKIVVTWNDEEIVDDVINDILYYLLLVEFDGDGETMKLTITGEDCIFYNDRVEYDGVVIGTLQGNIVSENTLVTEMSTSGVTLD